MDAWCLVWGFLIFQGAGEAGVGIGELIAMALEKKGLSHAEAMQRCYFMDSKGLVCKSRDNLQPHKARTRSLCSKNPPQ